MLVRRLAEGYVVADDFPVTVAPTIALRIVSGELRAVPRFDGDRNRLAGKVDPVEALALLSHAGRCRRSRLHDQCWPGASDEVAGVVDRSVVVMPGKQHVDPGVADSIERKFAPADGAGHRSADLEREQRMVRDQDLSRIGIGPIERVADEPHLVLIDSPVLEGERTGGVDSKHRRTRDFLQRAERVVDVARVAGQRRQEAAEDVVERDVVVAGNRQHLVPGVAEPFEEAARFLELLGPGTLGEIAADDHQVGLGRVHFGFYRLDQFGVVGAEVEVGQMDQASHELANARDSGRFIDTCGSVDRTHANTGTRPVSEKLRFDEAALEGWMSDQVAGFRGPIAVSQFKGGQSNPTYRIDSPSGAYVLRRKPPGKLLPGAHAVEREFRVLAALGEQGFPVARVHGLCEDESVIGTPFYVMDMVDGRIFWEAQLPGLSAQERAQAFDSMNATIARLHDFDPAAIGLGDYGKPTGFVERQVARWSKQYLGDVEAGRIAAMDRLVEWLGKHLPPDSGQSSVVHGDFRCDNMIFDAKAPAVRAVLDWELSTLGDPAADFTYHLLMYRMPHDLFAGLGGIDIEPLGIPSEDAYVAAYCRRTGRDHLPNKDYLIVFCLFRLAAIIHGIKGRIVRGTASSAHAAQMVERLEPLAELAWSEAQKATL